MLAKVKKRIGKTKYKKPKPMKYIERKNVQFVGLSILESADQKQIKQIIHDHYIEIERELKQITSLKLHFKQYEKGGRKKYSVQLLINAKTRPITVNKVYSPVQWDPVAAVHLIIDKAKREISHKFHTDDSYQKE
ncbi:hypothetical protein KY331_00985 [Candidatus Woesearchaeota archaeon]|nr:hypothetical protein [Candidatus Woesearchaeota archaeon]